MKSRNPKKYMEKDLQDSSLSKFQPSRSLIFAKLPTIEEKTKQQRKTKNDDDN
jgi:hypothetical protein